ncbi:GGDEF domain-containing protein [Nakamurella panacisegetis]|nr:GGDEF domain-containing protein [Nakamurella panacisegetis]
MPRWFRHLQPRDAKTAARIIGPLCIVAATVTIVFSVFDLVRGATDAPTAIATILVSAVVVAVGLATRRLRGSHVITWGSLPILGVLAIVGFDLASGDASVSAQVFLFFPALYAASTLPRIGVIIVTLTAIAGEAVIVFAAVPAATGAAAVGYVSAGLATASVLLARSAEEQEVLIARLRRQAAIDPLTGLATRRVLDQAAQSALSGAASSAGTGMILLDVDKFKDVNDRYGHPAGDEVLVQLAALLIRGCRKTDIVSRLGGDEIALLLPGCSPDSLLKRASSILLDVRNHAFIMSDLERIRVSVTAGVAHAPTHACDLPSLYATADAALYEAKRAGRDQVGVPARLAS